MNFKLVALLTLIGVGLTVRGDAHNGKIEIVDVKTVTPHEFAQELIDMKAPWKARDAFERLSLEDREKVRKALLDKFLIFGSEHGSVYSMRMEYKMINEKRSSDAQRDVVLFPAVFAATFSAIAFWDLFARVYGFDDLASTMSADFRGKFGSFTPNQISATIVLAGAALASVGFGIVNYLYKKNNRLNKESRVLDDTMNELHNIRRVLEYCA